MIFHETPLAGAYVIEPERRGDNRGFFARLWCQAELAKHGLVNRIAQANVGFSHRRGTLRGLHFQSPPHAEVKIVRCTRGSVFDVIVDLRKHSPTYQRWFGVELTEENFKMIYAPEGFAQGYLTLEDNSEIYYNTSYGFEPKSASGVRSNDPAFGIEWPIPIAVISDQDQKWPDFVGQGGF